MLLAVRDGREAVLVERLSAHGAGRILYRVGGRMPLHCPITDQRHGTVAALSVVTRSERPEPAVVRPAVVAVARAISRAPATEARHQP